MDDRPRSHVGNASGYHGRWIGWVRDPSIEIAGITFDRTPSGPIHAPPDAIRVCAYHIDFDERPVCYIDVADIAEARFICSNISAARGQWNVDYAVAYDPNGHTVVTVDWA